MNDYIEERKNIRGTLIEYFKSFNEYDLGGTQMNTLRTLFLKKYGSDVGRDDKFIGIALEEIQNLIDLNIIRLGSNSFEINTVFLFLTSYGKKCIEEESINILYDPDCFLDHIKNTIPDIDSIILKYIGESIVAYNKKLLISATVTLGVASEKAILNLIESYINCSFGNSIKSKIEKMMFINMKYTTFIKDIYNKKKQISEEFDGDLNDCIDNIEIFFKLIKRNRNYAGHPTGKAFDIDELYSHIITFKKYLKNIYDLIKHFENNI